MIGTSVVTGETKTKSQIKTAGNGRLQSAFGTGILVFIALEISSFALSQLDLEHSWIGENHLILAVVVGLLAFGIAQLLQKTIELLFSRLSKRS